MSKHTPGPWEWDDDGALRQATTRVEILDSMLSDEVKTEDADLIAAAPDLLAAAKWSLEVLLGEDSEDKACECEPDVGKLCLTCTLQAAIAKADGAAQNGGGTK